MKKLLIPIFGFLLALGLFQFGAQGEVLAQISPPPLIVPTSNDLIAPSTFQNDINEGSWRVLVRRIIDFVLLSLLLIGTVGIIVASLQITLKVKNKILRIIAFLTAFLPISTFILMNIPGFEILGGLFLFSLVFMPILFLLGFIKYRSQESEKVRFWGKWLIICFWLVPFVLLAFAIFSM